MKIGNEIKTLSSKYQINRMVAFYMSVLEHQWIIIVEAGNAHDVENLCIESGISAYNTVKIVPLNSFEIVMRRIGVH